MSFTGILVLATELVALLVYIARWRKLDKQLKFMGAFVGASVLVDSLSLVAMFMGLRRECYTLSMHLWTVACVLLILAPMWPWGKRSLSAMCGFLCTLAFASIYCMFIGYGESYWTHIIACGVIASVAICADRGLIAIVFCVHLCALTSSAILDYGAVLSIWEYVHNPVVIAFFAWVAIRAYRC